MDAALIRLEDFDISPDTGFLGSQPHVHLTGEWTVWEDLLEDAMKQRLVLGENAACSEPTLMESARWRAHVCEAPLLSAAALDNSVQVLRRAHHVLSFILHFYVHTLPPETAIHIPASLAIPLAHVSDVLDLPPVITYSDLVLYNWTTDSTSNIYFPSVFSGRLTNKPSTGRPPSLNCEAFSWICGRTAITRSTISRYGPGCAVRIRCLGSGQFQDVAGDSGEAFKELSGPSAGQSTLIHALDIFFGINNHLTNGSTSLFGRMQRYMPQEHRRFLACLSSAPRSLRDFIQESNDRELTDAYNGAVSALKAFRDTHLIIATLYIVVPANRKRASKEVEYVGTGGTGLVPFLKGVRDRTKESVLPTE
ncbi:hypothetical protein EDD18DRAFT_1148517 [Armillaria luteobubalina]|uniref:Indoleamine 2,3-dioxygenase n=1 Tax=Armillaria luteobubalina TaxID=153913 RepID=A0AA39QD38_9AGAR|nr:hypothetical protein EDD18DRAFT_1148517 [Armillaria luteobubalina]